MSTEKHGTAWGYPWTNYSKNVNGVLLFLNLSSHLLSSIFPACKLSMEVQQLWGHSTGKETEEKPSVFSPKIPLLCTKHTQIETKSPKCSAETAFLATFAP